MKFVSSGMPRISNFMRTKVIEMLKSEKSLRQVAKDLKYPGVQCKTYGRSMLKVVPYMTFH